MLAVTAPPLSRGAPASTGDGPSRPNRGGSEIASLLLRCGVLSEAQFARVRRVQEKIPGRTFLSVASELGYASDEQARKALRENRLSVGIGALLVELGYVKASELDAALEIQSRATGRKKLGDILIEQRFIDELRLIEVLAMQLGFPQLTPDYASLDRDLMQKVNPKWCVQHLVVPLRTQGSKPIIAMADPLDRAAREQAESVFGPGIEIGIASRREILDAIATLEKGGRRVEAETATGAIDDTVVELVNKMILDALVAKASDVHIEPLKNRLRVRFRCDGVMATYRDYENAIASTLASRIKIMSGASISEKRRHQDGRIHFEDPTSGQSADLRVSFYATLLGQKIVMRVLNHKATRIDIRDSGIGPRVLERFMEEALDVPSGVILITGPTGSGKTTTLYGAVNYLNNDETCIVTAEDPVEYVVDGIAQCSINPQLNITFEETLRHMVRQDPDVIVLGEIRDRFSADAAI